MSETKRNASISFVWWIGLACVGGVGAFIGLTNTEISVSAKAERKFNLQVDMDTFRQILVRTKATEAILNHGGMKLLDESTETVAIDLKNDSRPLRNFLRGKSKANVSATKHLKVQLNDAQIKASELFLTQECRLQPDVIHIVTTSDGPTGELERYITTLEAVKGETGTDITLTIDMTVRVKVAWAFQSRAKTQVELAANKTLKEQEQAIHGLIEDGASNTSIR